MSEYPETLYGRVINPGTEDEFLMTSADIRDVSDENVSDNDSASATVARYVLVGTGTIHHTAPRYVENSGT